MKKIILIGSSGVGKSTLGQVLLGKGVDCQKTQALEYKEFIIDTPGEYIENRGFYTALISSAVDADIIGIVVDATASQFYLPPNFVSIFAKPTIGIITKIDALEANIARAINVLEQVGVSKIIKTSAYEQVGIDKLKKILEIN